MKLCLYMHKGQPTSYIKLVFIHSPRLVNLFLYSLQLFINCLSHGRRYIRVASLFLFEYTLLYYKNSPNQLSLKLFLKFYCSQTIGPLFFHCSSSKISACYSYKHYLYFTILAKFSER